MLVMMKGLSLDNAYIRVRYVGTTTWIFLAHMSLFYMLYHRSRQAFY